MSKFVTSFLKDESGASAAEYVLILALVGLAIVLGATALGGALNKAMDDTATKIGDAVPA
ncbi:Flp family type IVb pilin [Asticcacaulis taihuensis]|uniref:Pilus assembly protein Flp/PilA n=1 Tax=Asticcacaulis taihuensis TaxID=260084 RepID=A0A1G4RVE8_9CAUL|nr:Flp family type IVb pilin [Asticcacaulis taihuensis]SCW60059.1 pilus assembly protein Flp/PilA [Asticcacaulis taihuensis]